MYKYIIAIFFFSFTKIFACLNGERLELKNGTIIFMDRDGGVPYGHLFSDDKYYTEGVKELDSLYFATKNIDYLSDKGLLLILLKKYNEAIKLYLQIEKTNPNRYSTASNVGTAYELIGENSKAIEWIKKAIKIDSTSHKNSEWIHVKILEAKIKGEEFYTSKYILNLNFGTDSLPKTYLSKIELKKLEQSLYYQLNERVSFIKPKEKIVANLLFELGNICFLLGSYGDAQSNYQLAKEYGYNDSLIQKRVKLLDRLAKSLWKKTELRAQYIHTSNLNRNSYLYLIIGLISLLIIITIFYLYKKQKK